MKERKIMVNITKMLLDAGADTKFIREVRMEPLLSVKDAPDEDEHELDEHELDFVENCKLFDEFMKLVRNQPVVLRRM